MTKAPISTLTLLISVIDLNDDDDDNDDDYDDDNYVLLFLFPPISPLSVMFIPILHFISLVYPLIL